MANLLRKLVGGNHMKKTVITFTLILSLVCLIIPVFASPVKQTPDKTILYASLGEELSRYELDVASATLTKRGSVTLPANLQFAAIHPSGHYLYTISSNAGSGTTGAAGDKHLLQVFKIDSTTGALQMHGEPFILPERPIHITIDRAGEYALVAFNQSGTIRVYKIMKDGAIGEEVAQPVKLECGIFTHQVVVTPSNNTVIALSRGNEGTKTRPADIGSRTTFDFKNGVLSQKEKVNYEDGIGPRHLAFHPTQPWVYVAVERGSKLFMHTIKEGMLSQEPLFTKETLIDLENIHRDRQKGGVVKIHPNGKFLYVTNRADGTVKENGKTISAGGENNIAVFSINEKTGEPTLIQHIDGQGIEGRTFAIDPSGQLFIVANQKAMLVHDGETLKTVPANFAVFKIASDGKLEFIRKYDVTSDSNKWLLWMDMFGLN